MYIKHINDEGSSHSAASLRMEAVNLPERWMSLVVKLPLFRATAHDAMPQDNKNSRSVAILNYW